jgi:hypothetical protein
MRQKIIFIFICISIFSHAQKNGLRTNIVKCDTIEKEYILWEKDTYGNNYNVRIKSEKKKVIKKEAKRAKKPNAETMTLKFYSEFLFPKIDSISIALLEYLTLDDLNTLLEKDKRVYFEAYFSFKRKGYVKFNSFRIPKEMASAINSRMLYRWKKQIEKHFYFQIPKEIDLDIFPSAYVLIRKKHIKYVINKLWRKMKSYD